MHGTCCAGSTVHAAGVSGVRHCARLIRVWVPKKHLCTCARACAALADSTCACVACPLLSHIRVSAIGSVRWAAKVRVNGKAVRLGLFDSEEDAIRAYNAARIQHGLGEACRPCPIALPFGASPALRSKLPFCRPPPLPSEPALAPAVSVPHASDSPPCVSCSLPRLKRGPDRPCSTSVRAGTRGRRRAPRRHLETMRSRCSL